MLFHKKKYLIGAYILVRNIEVLTVRTQKKTKLVFSAFFSFVISFVFKSSLALCALEKFLNKRPEKLK